MIVVKVKGGLGNQMFQYAMARKLQMATGIKKIGLDLKIINSDHQRDYGLSNFVLCNDVRIVDKSEKSIINRMQENLDKRANCYFIAGRPYDVCEKREKFLSNVLYLLGVVQKDYTETNINILIKYHNNIFMNGWFQESKPLLTIRNILLEDFKWKNSVPVSNYNMKKKIEESESVCVHIRRGDYVKHPLFGVCTDEYYYKAMEIMALKVKNPLFFIFSDSIMDVKQNMRFPYQVIFENPEDRDYEGLYLMSRCKHFIMSNSTFSWWGQFLCEYKNKNVIAPSRWYTINNMRADMYMDEWILIDV